MRRAGQEWSAGLALVVVFSGPAGSEEFERVGDRARMVAEQIETRGVRDPKILEAMRRVPRHRFVPPEERSRAYEDRPLSIGEGQTISQPYIVAKMTELAHLEADDVVFELGTGSGYQAAVAAEIVKRVYSVEIHPTLADRAMRVIADLGYGNVSIRAGDGTRGWPEAAPFDAVLVTAAFERIPARLVEQLRPGGRAVVPVGPLFGVQRLHVFEKNEDGSLTEEEIFEVRFVSGLGPETGISP